MRTPTAIDGIADDYTRKLAALNPLTATDLGIVGYDHLVGDWSPAGHAARADLARDTVRALDAIEPADETDRVTRAAMRERLALEVELFEAGEYKADLNVIASLPQALRDVLDLMPTETEAQWRSIAERIAGIPDAIDGYIACLTEGIASGPMPAKRQCDEVAKQADELARHVLFRDVLRRSHARRRARHRRTRGGPDRGRGCCGSVLRQAGHLPARGAGTARPVRRWGRPRTLRPIQPTVRLGNRRP